MAHRLTLRVRGWLALDGRIWRMAFARAINTMGLSLVMAFLGVYVVEERGYPAWLYGVIALAANLGQSVASAWAGALSDRIGRRPVMVAALSARAVVIALLGVQVLLHAPLWSLAVNIFVGSSLRGGFEPVAYAFVADVAGERDRIAAFGLQRMGINLGWALGPAIGGVLTLWIPYGTVFFAATLGLALAAWVIRGVVDPNAAAAAGVRDAFASADARAPRDRVLAGIADAWRNPVLRPLLVGTFLAALLHTQMFSTFAIYLSEHDQLSKGDVGLLYSINGLAVVVLQMPALLLVERLGDRRTLVLAPVIEGFGFALVGLMTGVVSGFSGAALAIWVITVGEVLFGPSHQTAIAQNAVAGQRGRIFGAMSFAQMIGVAFAPVVGGVLLDATGHNPLGTWLPIAAIGLAQASALAIYARRAAAQP